ncbi:head GIN domain-containing protein [Hyphococcus formosus]|uniref:head GIN domain-containing protein n=1 Tax=Hyphococcus formosus TaxID=3143534 RepID=UPI00398A86FF
MKKAVLSAAGAMSAIALATTTASAETETYSFAGFSKLDVSAGVNVDVRVGEDYSVSAEGNQKAIDSLRFELDDDTLEIGRKRGSLFSGRHGKVTVYVELPRLEEVDVSSGSSLEAENIDAAEFEASVSSGARTELHGKCVDLDADGSSGASLDADDFKCEHAKADVSSGANLRIFAAKRIDADASSGGNITVYGNPKQTRIDKSSGGNISIRD